MNGGQAYSLSHSPTRETRADPLCVGYVLDGRVFSLIRGLPSSLSANEVPSLFEWFIGTMPQCDSSETYTRAVWPEPSPADLLPRFSCMKFLGVPGVFDYGGPSTDSRYRPCPCCLPRILTASASGLYVFAAQSPTPPTPCLRFTVSLTVAVQDSGRADR
jgi:hypothetical protein